MYEVWVYIGGDMRLKVCPSTVMATWEGSEEAWPTFEAAETAEGLFMAFLRRYVPEADRNTFMIASEIVS